MSAGMVIIGAGQAGGQLAISLREEGYDKGIALLGDEPYAPYQRPPLSKEFMAGKLPESQLPFRSPEFYEQQDIWLKANASVVEVDRAAQYVVLSSGERIPYEKLVFATGARNRLLPFGEHTPQNVHYLRTRDDALRLRTAMGHAQSVLIVGAGFIGLEFASVACEHDVQVTVVEMADRVMARAVSPEVSEHFAKRHRQRGVDIRCSTAVDEYLFDALCNVRAVRIGNEEVPVDLLLVGIGVVPNDEVAATAGLETSQGIVVDASLATEDPNVYAIGDCARFTQSNGEKVRLESVPNAADQARFLAKHLCHGAGRYAELPWFWSHQAGDKLQIAGLSTPQDEALILGNPDTGRYSVARLRDGYLVAVESTNSAGDHLASRKILSSGVRLSTSVLSAPDFSLKRASMTTAQAPSNPPLPV